MKIIRFALLALIALPVSCAGQRGKVILRPDPNQGQIYVQPDPFDSWQVIESQNGIGDAELPEWIKLCFSSEAEGTDSQRIESLYQYNEKYVFIGENHGENFNALQQWANGFSEAYDLPRLVAHRVEQRLVSSASLYPDDEYGEFFVNMIRKAFDGEYPGAAKEQTFWIKRRIISSSEEYLDDNDLPVETISERYDFFVLLSIDRVTLQEQIRQMMASTRNASSATRDQAAAIAKIQQVFFEGF